MPFYSRWKVKILLHALKEDSRNICWLKAAMVQTLSYMEAGQMLRNNSNNKQEHKNSLNFKKLSYSFICFLASLRSACSLVVTV